MGKHLLGSDPVNTGRCAMRNLDRRWGEADIGRATADVAFIRERSPGLFRDSTRPNNHATRSFFAWKQPRDQNCPRRGGQVRISCALSVFSLFSLYTTVVLACIFPLRRARAARAIGKMSGFNRLFILWRKRDELCGGKCRGFQGGAICIYRCRGTLNAV